MAPATDFLVLVIVAAAAGPTAVNSAIIWVSWCEGLLWFIVIFVYKTYIRSSANSVK